MTSSTAEAHGIAAVTSFLESETLALHDHGGYRMAVIPASHRLDLHRTRTLLGATSHLRLATEAELARDFPMFEVGAMPPLGAMMPMPEIVDVHLLYHERILCAGGDHKHSILIDPRDLLRVSEPRVASLCETPDGHSRFRDLPHI